MDFALGYIVGRFFYRIYGFFHHWYIDGSRRFLAYGFDAFSDLDQIFAVRMTVRYFFHPLYKDYSIVGRILGIVFRSGRLVVAFALYGMLGALFLAAYLLWCLVPLLILFYIFENRNGSGI